MPTGITIPVFEDEEILLYEKLNAFAQAVDARFSAGIGTSDLTWPLMAENNLNMSVYNIIGGHNIWDVANAYNYDSLALAITGAGTNGVVLVPPNQTVTTSGNQAIGGSGVSAIVGTGPKSVLQLSAGSVSMLVAASAGTGLYIANLTLDGNSQATANGLDISSYADVVIENVRFVNFDGKAITLTSMTNATIRNCVFSGNDIDIYSDGCGFLTLSDNIHYACNEHAIQIAAAGAGTICHVHAANCEFRNIGQSAVSFAGFGAVGAANDCEFHGTNLVVKQTGATYDGFSLGTSAAALNRVNLSGCTINAAGAVGVKMNTNKGSVTGCIVDNPTTTCIDLDTSVKVKVSDNLLLDGTVGVDMSDAGCDDCYATDNKISGCTAVVSYGANTSDQYGNTGQVGVLPMSGWCVTGSTACATNVITYASSYAIPANTLNIGDKLSFDAVVRVTGAAGAVATSLQMNSVDLVAGSASTGDTVLMHVELVMTHATTGWKFAHIVNSDGTSDAESGAVTGLDITAAQTVRTKFNTEGLGSTDGWVDGGVCTVKKVEIQ